MNLFSSRYGLLALLLLFWAACGGAESNTSSQPAGPASAAQEDGVTQAELEKGIGPITGVELSATIDAALASQGESIFTTKCAACHKLEERYVGPPLGQVLSRRTPEFVMNMMLNPEEMVKRHPVVKELLAQFLTPMPNQNLTADEARAVLEYLRNNQEENEETEEDEAHEAETK